MTTISEHSTQGQEDNVEVAVYDTSDLSSEYPDWDELSDKEKLDVLQNEEPTSQFSDHNVTTNDYHLHLANLANPNSNTAVKTASHIAFGNNDTLPSPSNSALNNEQVRFEVTDKSVSGLEYQSITLLSSDQAVGVNLEEAGLFDSAAGGMMFNHVLLSDDPLLSPKTQDYAVTIRINLQYKDASEV